MAKTQTVKWHDPLRGKHGLECLEYKVLVRPVEETGVLELKGGFKLYKPDETKERDEHAAMEGIVEQMSELAFSYDENSPRPAIGDKVIFQKFAGIRIKGADGVEYRLMNDKDIVARRTA